MDVNVLVAWGWADHLDHERTVRWIAGARKQKQTILATSSIPELGFIRVSVQRSPTTISVELANLTLTGMLKSLGKTHFFLADNLPGADLPLWCRSASHTTDGHLCQLALRNDAVLATLDEGIPGAFLIP